MSSFWEKNCFGTQEGGTYSTDENIITLLPFFFGLISPFRCHTHFINVILLWLFVFALHIHYIWLFLSNPCGVIIIFCFVCSVFSLTVGGKEKKPKKRKGTRGPRTSHHPPHLAMQLRFVSFLRLIHCQYYSQLIGSTLIKETRFRGQFLKYWDTGL